MFSRQNKSGTTVQLILYRRRSSQTGVKLEKEKRRFIFTAASWPLALRRVDLLRKNCCHGYLRRWAMLAKAHTTPTSWQKPSPPHRRLHLKEGSRSATLQYSRYENTDFS